MIERTDIQSVLTQMRAMKEQAQMGVSHVNDPAEVAMPSVRPVAESNDGFGSLLKSAIDGVNNTQMEASRLATAYEQGDTSVELTQVMVQLQKASVSFQAMTEVRNRLVSAYEDVMNMSI